MITDHGSLINARQGRAVYRRQDACTTNNAREARPSSNSYLLTPNSSANSYLLPPNSSRSAFSLAEILIAIFVLSIGLIMIAAVFPVAAKWTAQDAQTSVAQVIAKNAVATIQTQGLIPSTGGAIGPYCYNFGNASPYPNANPAPAAPTTPTPPPGSYYWSAVILPASSTTAGSSGVYPGTQNNLYTIYVFVFNKGDLSNTFTASGTPLMQPVAQPVGPSYYPQLAEGTYSAVAGTSMPVGSQGLDVNTGGVFRLIVNASNAIVPTGTAVANPTGDTIIYAPPAINQTSSPLIYVYVTTVSL